MARERLALPFHRRTGGSVTLCNPAIPWQYICTAQELPHRRMQAPRFRPSGQSDEQSSPAVIEEMQTAAIGTARTCRTTAGCFLIRWLTVLVSGMYRVILSTRQTGHGLARSVADPRQPESLPERWHP